MAHMRQSRPDSDLEFQVQVLKYLSCFDFARKLTGFVLAAMRIQGYLAHKTTPIPQGPP